MLNAEKSGHKDLSENMQHQWLQVSRKAPATKAHGPRGGLSLPI